MRIFCLRFGRLILRLLLEKFVRFNMECLSGQRESRMVAVATGWKALVRNTCNFVFLGVGWIMNHPVDARIWHSVSRLKYVSNGSHL